MLSREQNWPQFWQTQIEPFWHEHAMEWVYQPQADFNVHYALIENPNADKCLLLIPGRVESYLKYKELIFDFFQQGYSIVTLDHRGQGQSCRESTNLHFGHVNNFSTYADDLHAICQETRLYQRYKQVNLLAHSMGGAIALDYAYRYQPKLASMVLSAPLLGINAGPLTPKLALKVVKLVMAIKRVTEPNYFIGQKPYHRSLFTDNTLCSSESRFEMGQELISTPELQLGGVTYQWLQQALLKLIELHNNVAKLNVPCLVLQAEAEKIVNNKAQNKWVTLARKEKKEIEFCIIEKAKHEILMEQDKIREPALTKIINYFDAH
ncbi:alpha/beta fold hydrolase [Algibacillus agarilyticus]|uniref:alpha/beta fold hydrolase n=1 Tax=Algibacillus agarilyticus TaxID=2234133 RepID=UPI000DCFF38E|nr:alpha/beta fold hydrolase [Algibacillus agarilyticus]